MDDYSEDLHDKGESLFYEGDYEEAVKVLTKALKEEERPYSYYTRGFSYLEMKKFHKAIEDFDKAIELNDSDASYYAAKGVSHERIGENELCHAAYLKAVDLDPSAQNLENMALSCKRLGEYNKSLEFFYRTLEKKDDKSLIYVLISGVYKRMGQIDKVWDNLIKAVEENPQNVATYLDTMELYITEEQYRDGLAFIKKYEDTILEHAVDRQRLLFLYLKATIYLCLNMGIDSFEDEIRELASKKMEMLWYFGHTREWLKNSSLRYEAKEKIEELTDLID